MPATRLSLALTLAAAFAAGSAQANITLTFQEGLNGYVGTQDTLLRSADARSSYGNDNTISVDGDDGGLGNKPNHGLIRFDNLFGFGAGQIHGGDTIVSATLKVRVFNSGSGMRVHDMLTTWSESSTWNSLDKGVQADDTQAASTALVTLGANNASANVFTGMLSLNVTSSLRAMQGGATLYGWAMLPFASGINGIDFRSSEYANRARRPLLSVEVIPVPVPEPETYALMLAGLAGVVAAARRRKPTSG